MKATGIVRRIDDLGRVVIPKEIRRTMRIREGDPLEIYTGSGGEVVFRKYSPVGELGNIAGQYAEAVATGTKLGIVIADRDRIVAAAGVSKKDIVDREISPELSEIMEGRQPYVFEEGKKRLSLIAGETHTILAAYPIISAGDLLGAVALIPTAAKDTVGETDLGLASVAAAFLGRQLED
ncbi:MAG: AbrB/MazE/SpoVT family DNA-binding domain-containing protein [Clostridia bacterium]|nr:AbrB/MazE/SpoVT family DNA-binding domain-containing protein [Clostridia bacterium]